MKVEMIKLTLIQGDCLEVLKKLRSESVDLVVTDPPYFILNTVSKIQKEAKDWDSFEDMLAYKKFTTKYLNELYRIMKDNTSCCLFWSERHLFAFDEIIQQTKFNLHKILIWHYPNILKGFSNKRWHNTFDFIFHLAKGKVSTFNASFVKGENIDVWRFPKPQFNFKKDHKYHSTQKPLELIKRLIKILSNPNDTVLDPFLGSGTTMQACLELNRNCIGVEINPEYVNVTKKRLNWGHSLGDVEFEFYMFEKTKSNQVPR